MTTVNANIAKSTKRRRRPRLRLTLAVAAALAAISSAPQAIAQEDIVPSHPMMSDTFFFSVGAFYPETNSQASASSGTVGLGTFIDFEDDLGVDDTKVVAQFMFRAKLSERWRLETEYFKLSRGSEKQISRNIQFRNLNIPINESVNSHFSFEDARIGVGYSFFRTKDKEVGVGIGVHVVKLEASLETSTAGAERASVSAPLPTITFYSQMALTNRWLLDVRLDRLSLDVGNTDGSVFSTGIDLVYQPWRHVNVGFGYRAIAMRISTTKDQWRGDAQLQHNGPLIFVGTTF